MVRTMNLALQSANAGASDTDLLQAPSAEIAPDIDIPAEHFRSVVECSDDAIICKTVGGLITSWNPGARAIFGYTADEMLGQPMLRLIPPENHNEEVFILEKIVAGEKVDHFEAVRLNKQGGRVHVSVTISPIHDRQGRVVGASKIARDISARVKLEEETRLFENIVQSTDDAVIGRFLDGTITTWNPAAEKMFGYSASEMIGRSIRRLLPHDRGLEDVQIFERIRQGEKVKHFETIRQRKDGSLVEVSVNTSPIRDRYGQIVGSSKIVRDISAQKSVETQLRLTACVFTHTSEGILITDRDSSMVDVNRAFTAITGYDRDDVMGKFPSMFHSSRQGPEVFKTMWISLLRRGEWRGEVWSRKKDGEAYSALINVSRVRGSTGKVQRYVALLSDITPLRLEQKKLEHWAHFDRLTNLPNRWLLSDRLQQARAACLRSKCMTAVLYLDLDGFKSINDRYGHAVGDELLRAIAQRARGALRDVDTLARMGGDEFVAVLANLHSADDGIRLTERILLACSQPMEVQGLALSISASIGVTMYPQDDSEPEILMRHADQAMYEAKQRGKNRYHVFDAAHSAALKSRSAQQERIADAIARDELVLHYQPKVNMRTGEVLGYEALVRWQHPERGLLMPGEFLPAIDKHPLSEALDSWVMKAALHQMNRWCALNVRLTVSVNVGARLLQQPHFPDQLSEILAEYPAVDANRLELEILETSALEDIRCVSEILHACRRTGVRFAIDDFGTGYSSLTYLRRLPVDTLKIDQSFVRDMLIDQDDLAIVNGVIGLAAAFRRQVIAEGVETVAHGLKLLASGCELAQGYVIARPMPGSEVLAWASNWKTFPAWRDYPIAS